MTDMVSQYSSVMRDKQVQQTSKDILVWKKKMENRKKKNMRQVAILSEIADDDEGTGNNSSIDGPLEIVAAAGISKFYQPPTMLKDLTDSDASSDYTSKELSKSLAPSP